MRYELSIEIIDEKYADSLAIALVRQGYNVYYNADEKKLCFTICDDNLQKLKD